MTRTAYKVFEVSQFAQTRAVELGILEDMAGQVQNMARLAAPVTHPMFNRRYGDFVLWIDEAGVVQDLARIEANYSEYMEAHINPLAEECDLCDGTMLARVYEEVDGVETPMFRPCAKAMNSSLLTCDIE